MSKTETKLQMPERLTKYEETAKKIKDAITIDKDGTCTVKEGLFEECLPEGMTKEKIVESYKAVEEFTASAVLGAGEKCVEFWKKHPKADVPRIEIELDTVGKDKLVLGIDKQHQFRNPSTGETGTKNARVVAKLVHKSKTTGSDVKPAIDWISKMGEGSW